METRTKPLVVSPHPKHLRDRVRQIWLPFGVFAAIILALMILTIVASTGAGNNLDEWMGVSVVFLVIPAFLITLVGVVITAGLAYLVTKGIGGLPNLTRKIRQGLLKFQSALENFSDRAASPVVSVNGWQAGVKRLREIIFRR